MDFKFNDEQEILKDSARNFFKKNCDKKVVRELESSESGHSAELWGKMAELGWMGTIIPEEYDGIGCTLLELAVIFEEMGRAAAPGPFFCNTLSALAILEGGNESQKKELLPKIASGELLFTMAIEEPEVNYNFKAISMAATSQSDNFIINGTKLFVPYAAVADYILVVARTQGAVGDENGLTIFMVDNKAAGIEITPMKTIAADKQYQIDLNSVTVPSSNILGNINDCFPVLESIHTKARAMRCVEMVGGAQQELEMTAEYTRERKQFDRPIGTFQAAQHRLADMYVAVQGARLGSYNAVFQLSKNRSAHRDVAMAKYFTSKACREVALSAQQLHGGMGASLEYDLHFYFRRAKAMELQLGPPSYHLRALGAEL
jgi:alkylation response protein AidB-like acyl-CoA dehydrogenase